MSTFIRRVLNGDATKDQARDTGMAIVLIFLLAALARRKLGYVTVAIIAHVVNMTAPQVFRWAAVLWFGFSHLLGAVVSKLVMMVIFFVVVTPIGMWRRLRGADPLQLKTFKAGRDSVMEARNHTYTGKDLEQPY
jgi:hypothetical protein